MTPEERRAKLEKVLSDPKAYMRRLGRGVPIQDLPKGPIRPITREEIEERGHS